MKILVLFISVLFITNVATAQRLFITPADSIKLVEEVTIHNCGVNFVDLPANYRQARVNIEVISLKAIIKVINSTNKYANLEHTIHSNYYFVAIDKSVRLNNNIINTNINFNRLFTILFRAGYFPPETSFKQLYEEQEKIYNFEKSEFDNY